MTNREARALLFSCDHTQRHTDATRDLLTEPRWGKWTIVPDYEDGPATQIDARDTVLVLFVARPEPAACWAAWGIGGAVVLVLLGMALRALGAF